MQRVNIHEDEYDRDDDDPEGYAGAAIHITKRLGAEALAVKSFLIPPGQALCPYHYEFEEEWLMVLEGSVLVRTPSGEHQLGRGDVVAFPAGPEGAHKVSNQAEVDARLVMFSSAREPSVAVYPDSDKIGVWPGNEADKLMVRRKDGAIDYWDGEV